MRKVLAKISEILAFIFILVFCTLIKPTDSFASDPTNTWTSTTSLPYLLASHVSFSSGNKVFVIGGSAVTGQSKFDVLTSTPSADGGINSWTTTSLTPTALIFHNLAKKNNHVYILGGKEENPGSALDYVNKVYLGVLDNDGIVVNWQLVNGLPEKRGLGAAVVSGNRIYYAGGRFSDAITKSEVYGADINPDGTLGTWSQVGSLPEPLFGFGMVEYNNNLIIVGGYNGSVYRDKAYKATVNPDGTVSGWTNTSTLPEPVYRSGIIRIGSTLISVGSNQTTLGNKVFYVNINSNGTLGAWQTSSNTLPQAVGAGAITYSNGYLYLTGGFNGAYLDTVYYTPVNISEGATLPVPYYTQNSLPWGPTEYDSAASLGISSPTMDRWGCAVTSAAMILKYHGMNEFPNGDPMNPGNLNLWLDNNNGYKKSPGSSVIFWSSIQRLSNELFNAGKSNVKLIHSGHKPSSNTTNLLNNDLTTEKIPHLLQVTTQWGSHYIVAKGVLENGYSVNDPEWNYPDLSNFTNNSYQYTHRYLPSQTNFSYIEFLVDPNVEVLVTDSQGRKTGKKIVNGRTQEFIEIPNSDYYFEPPIANPKEEGLAETLGLGVNRFLLPGPLDGEYTLLLTSTRSANYSLEIHALESDGDYIANTLEGIVDPDTSDSYQVQYSQTLPSSIVNISEIFQNLIDDVNQARSLNQIDSDHLSNRLIRIINQALGHYQDGRVNLSLKKLDRFEDTLNRNGGDGISEDAYQTLLNDVTSLKTHL